MMQNKQGRIAAIRIRASVPISWSWRHWFCCRRSRAAQNNVLRETDARPGTRSATLAQDMVKTVQHLPRREHPRYQRCGKPGYRLYRWAGQAIQSGSADGDGPIICSSSGGHFQSHHRSGDYLVRESCRSESGAQLRRTRSVLLSKSSTLTTSMPFRCPVGLSL
jgi:hypothetical protein